MEITFETLQREENSPKQQPHGIINSQIMPKWDSLSRPKDQGGLGIINTQIMNECLLVKWIWKIVKESNDTWYKLLEAKYMSDGNFFNSKYKGTSQFWQGLHKVKHLFKWGTMYTVGDGSLISFWGGIWLGQFPLKSLFLELFRICEDPTVLVSDCFTNDEWCVNFRRSLSPWENVKWNEILNLLQNVALAQDSRDDVPWALDGSKSFTTKSLYRFLTHRGVCIPASEDVWKTKLPLKIKIFMC